MRTDALEQSREPTRQRILAAAARLFSQAGYEATTVKDIARACELTDPALYYHFPSKREILNALLVGPHFDEVEMASAVEPSPETLAADLYDLFVMLSAHEKLLRLLFRRGLEEDVDARLFSEEVRASFRDTVMPALANLYGEQSHAMLETVVSLLAGLQLDGMIEFGDDYGTQVRSAEFEDRVQRLLQAALPPVGYAVAV